MKVRGKKQSEQRTHVMTESPEGTAQGEQTSVRKMGDALKGTLSDPKPINPATFNLPSPAAATPGFLNKIK
jgi:hypothetical protein